MKIKLNEIYEVIIKRSNTGKNIKINGKEIDLSKIISMNIEVDFTGIHLETVCVECELPLKESDKK